MGIWSNTMSEVVYFGGGTATPLSGSDTYTLTFPKDDLPKSHVQYFWSVICVDAVDYRVVPNAQNRFLLNQQSPLVYGGDGSLTLHFAPTKPPNAPEANWLPTPPNKNYVLTFRAYRPRPRGRVGQVVPTPVEEAMKFTAAEMTERRAPSPRGRGRAWGMPLRQLRWAAPSVLQ